MSAVYGLKPGPVSGSCSARYTSRRPSGLKLSVKKDGWSTSPPWIPAVWGERGDEMSWSLVSHSVTWMSTTHCTVELVTLSTRPVAPVSLSSSTPASAVYLASSS